MVIQIIASLFAQYAKEAFFVENPPVEMVEKAKARVVGILVILTLGNKWKSKLKGIKVDYVVKV